MCYHSSYHDPISVCNCFNTARRGGYTATVPALQGCISEGDTKEEALANIRDAIEGYLFVAKKHNLYPGIIRRADLTPEEFLKIK